MEPIQIGEWDDVYEAPRKKKHLKKGGGRSSTTEEDDEKRLALEIAVSGTTEYDNMTDTEWLRKIEELSGYELPHKYRGRNYRKVGERRRNE
jgi:hypothetical protein